jgi:ATP-binding cassette, subfamily B, bacterial
MRLERRAVRLSTYRATYYWVGTFAWIVFFIAPLLPGWVTSRVFRELERHGSGTRLWVLLGLLLISEVTIAVLIWLGHSVYMQGSAASSSLARLNVMDAQLASGGPDAGPRTVSVGDTTVRLRDDPIDVMWLIDNWVDLTGVGLYAAGAAVVLLAIDPLAALVGIAPLILVGLANTRVGHIVRRLRRRARQTSSDVGTFLNAAFEASLTVKVSGARTDVIDRLDELNTARSAASVRDAVWTDAQMTVNNTFTDVCIGLSLLVASRGSLNAAEVSLFASYLFNMAWLPQRIGGVISGRRRTEVSFQRLDELVATPAAGGIDRLTNHRPSPVLNGPSSPAPVLADRVPLHELEVRGLTVASRGLDNVDLRIARGSLTVIAGPVGSGKSSLLRAVIGLLAIDSGEVRWNGELVADRAAFFVPPNAAYVSQVPRLFAESLADNIALSYPISDATRTEAVRLAVFDDDLTDLPDGYDTLIGARGVRLSGGQAQRVGALRALVHQPELLVLDDLTSALDVETEIALWDRLAAAGFTVLAASNRPVALARADQIIRL